MSFSPTNDDASHRTQAEGVEGQLSERTDSGPAGSQPLSPDSQADSAEFVRQITVRVLSERIKLLGVDRSGAYEHYKLQLANGFPIGAGELAIMDFIRRQKPNLRSYHEVGSGLGTLPLMLACEGLAAVGIERDDRRHLTALAVLRGVSEAAPQVEGNCRLIGGSFPDAISDLDVSESLAILTDFVASQSPRDYIRLCHGLARYRYVVMDLQRFCSKRDSTEEHEQLIQDLAKCGLSVKEEIADLGGLGRYLLFESNVAAERRPLPGDAPRWAMPSAGIPAVTNPERSAMSNSVVVALRELEPSQPVVQSATVGSIIPRPTSLPPMPRQARPRRFGGWLGVSALLVIGLPSLLAVIYYGFLASRQYVTTFQFAVRGPSQAALRGGGSSLTSAGMMSPDSFVVTDYIKSPQAIADIERRLDIKAVFSKPNIDFWARLPQQVTSEELATYWNRMISASFDLISGNITVSVRAFSPADSLRLADALVHSSDRMFRDLNSQIQKDFVRVADDNVVQEHERLMSATQAVLALREKSGLVDPGKTAEAGASIVDDLRRQLAMLQSQYGSLKESAANSPALTGLRSQIAALEDQIRRESRLGTSQVRSVSAETLAKYQTLELERQTAEKLYTEAVSLRTQAYLVAQSQQSYLALFAAPTLPQSSLYPDRPRAIATVVLSAAVAWFIGMLVVYALRDHLM